VGQEIFQEVERLVGEEGLTRSEAFARIAAETGRRAGTVAANYYRVARRQSVASPPRGRPPGGARRAGSRPAAPGPAGDALDRLRQALQQLKMALAERERELERLRALDAQLRDLLGPTGRSRQRPRGRGR
jgi:hypothetical protein